MYILYFICVEFLQCKNWFYYVTLVRFFIFVENEQKMATKQIQIGKKKHAVG